MTSQHDRKEIYSIDLIMGHVLDAKNKPKYIDGVKYTHRVDLDGDLIAMDSKRYFVFLRQGTVCVVCGLSASFFAKERDKVQGLNKPDTVWHLNLYGLLPDGTEVLFTKDHIVPVAKKGNHHLTNLTVMCQPCNTAKGSQSLSDALLKRQRKENR